MKREPQKSDARASDSRPVDARGRLVRYLTIIFIMVVLGGAWAIVKKGREPKPVVESTSAPAQNGFRLKKSSASASAISARPEGETLAQDEISSPPTTATPIPDAVSVIPNRSPAEPVAAHPEPMPAMRQLVTSLTQIDLSRGVITQEQAGQWKLGLQQLVQQGAAAVPAIREFLEQKQDLNFDAIKDGSLTGYPSLRTGLFDALQQIGGPEALELSLLTLRTTADPLEIALLARGIEQQSPGQYRQDALNAARETLARAAQDQPNARDVAPLFQLFQTYGDASLLAELQQTLPRWNYYATMALAELPEGAGIPTLIRATQDPETDNATRNVALQMLAQGAAQYPDAGTALVEQARLNQISDYAWRQIAWVLGGDQYQFGSPFFDSTLPPRTGPGVRTYHIEAGNQNFYTTPVGANLSADQINQRRALIDQLLGVTSNPTAVQGLQSARTMLSGGQALN